MVSHIVIPMKPETVIAEFDRFLKDRGLSFQGVIIGGTALALMGVISRETQDCDVLDPEIPQTINIAAKEFASMQKKNGVDLKDNWLNNGPESLRKHLPKGWLSRCVTVFSGKALSLLTLGREDLLKTKFFAYCDRNRDLEDCLALKPTKEEFKAAIEWVQHQDANPDWPEHVRHSLTKLAKMVGHEL